MFETQQNRFFSGFGAVVACTANQAAAEKLTDAWVQLVTLMGKYPTLSKSVQDAISKGADAENAWFFAAYTSSGWCARKEDLTLHQSALERAQGMLAGEVASRGLVAVSKTPNGKVIVAPDENVTAGAGWWGLTLGVLALSAAAIVARRRRGLGGLSAPSYKRFDPRGWGGDPKRGAAMGRPTVHDAPKDEQVKFTLRRIRLNSGGYDPNGTYFGIGAPLYWYANDEGTVDAMLRATSRDEAKRKVLEKYPNANFYR